METILFKDEHLLIGNFGHFAVVLAFVAALISAFSYALSVNRNVSSLKELGKWMFFIHAISVVMIFFSLFYIIHSHYFEYQYAFQHSSTELPVYYMISCFWEGQEGSFLLWMFWHAVLGVILIFKSKSWQAPVMTVIALAQVILGSMLLGFQIGDFKIGSSPFELMREHNPEALLIPVLSTIEAKANYLQIFKDGNGLNPLLQNYWMVIHPPTLFLGFAATIVPFAFAFAGLWTKRLKEWIVPALPWALVAVMVLGTGIIMGGYWAYESLNFGGYWAWDPVENASLMPWLLMITATHMLVINKSTGKYPVLTLLLTIFSFFMVLYATFLTRSGVLGNASVHSFTDLGLSGQLLLLLFFFIFLTFALSFKSKLSAYIYFFLGFIPIMVISLFKFDIDSIAISWFGTAIFLVATVWFVKNLFKLFGTNIETDKLYSREFWMFVGSMVLLLSGFQIIIMTSIPVFNKLFGGSKASAGPDYYNQIQLWFAMVIVLLTAIGQYFKYKQSDFKKVLESISNSLLIAIILSVGAVFLFKIWELKYLFFLIASIYAVVANLHYLITVLKSKVKIAGGSIAHTGFGLMMIGILVSSVNKKVISVNNTGTGYFSETNAQGMVDEVAKTNNKENLLLVKDKTVLFTNKTLRATFNAVTEEKPNKYFSVKYEVLDEKGQVKDEFTLKPNSQNNPKMGLISNPDTRHFLTRDIFTHITYESSMEDKTEKEFENFRTDTVQIGQSFPTGDGNRQLTLTKINIIEAPEQGNRLHLQAEVIVNTMGDTFIARPEFISEEKIRFKESVINKAGVLVVFDRVITDPNDPKNMLFIITSGTRRPILDYIILKAIEFPYINLLWLGTFVLIFGFTLSIIQRFKEFNKREAKNI
ncbi:MAG: cytochrome c biogenesis protein CcsA [Bacteroidia bacterium]|nr:cytochrome c biogenesis protein CcsA [Bacteroidia bacterium]